MQSTVQFVLVLVLLSLISANEQLREVRQLQKQLAAATNADVCRASRTAAIARAEARLNDAIDCRFAGLTLCAYSQMKQLCRRRVALRRQVKGCQFDCSQARRKLRQALAACTVIRWDERGERRACPKLGPSRKMLRELRERKCPQGPDKSADELRAALVEAEKDAREALGLTEPAYKTVTIEPIGEVADSVVFVFHGFGQTVEQIMFVPQILTATGQFPKTRYVLPQAKEQFVKVFNRTGASWFNVLSNDPDGPQAVGEIIQAASNVNALMEIQREVYEIAPKRIVLAGFSQGGALSLTVYLRHEVGAAFIISGYLPIASTYPQALNPASQDSPAVMVHGDADDIVPVEIARLSKNILQALGRKVEYIEFPGQPHILLGVIPQVVDAAVDLYKKVLID